MDIRIDDLSGPEIACLLEQHIEDMKAASPPESKHALDLNGLRKPEITFWTIWDGVNLAGCLAMKELDNNHAEVKSMRVAHAFRNRGIASKLLAHMIQEAQNRNYTRLSLETGAMPFFEPARKLYQKFGFVHCEPFAGYVDDPNSVFMTKTIQS